MREDEDALGRQLLDYVHGVAGEAVLERDDGVVARSLAPAAFFAEWREWPAAEQRVFAHVRGRVLDVGCGAGRHSLEAQRRGHDVVAIDISPGAIEVCRRRGVRDARLLSLDAVDRTLGWFDIVLMMCGNFGLVGTVEHAPRVLRSLHEVTADDGAIILDSVDARQTTNPDNLAYHEGNRARGLPPGQVRLRLRYGECVTPWFDLLNVAPDELADVVNGTGWFVSDLEGTEGPDYYAVLRKT
ncbi:MAG TPA: class I SAM-dependent methyltransferase [Gaiellaceae bacterium]|nr:class I SAM-dependent methyltransferase [Gaiellaceae bacterium]